MGHDYYPVVPVSRARTSDYDERERLGSKEKFWFRHSDGKLWLFKYPRRESGEHWAEKIAAEIAALIGVNCAEVQLARCNNDLGVKSLSFTQPEWLKVHGNEIMVENIEEYDENVRFGQRGHNIGNIVAAIAKWAERNDMDLDAVQSELVSYAILDGLIGNTDRHHENWMFFYDPDQRAYELAPTYDHGSSLGRELQDVSRRISRSRQHILDSDGVLNYLLNRSSGGSVYANRHSNQAPPPLRTAQLICRWQPAVARPWLERLLTVPGGEFRGVINKVPPEFMSDTAKQFAYQFVMVSKSELLRNIT